MNHNELMLTTYRSEYAKDFESLNMAWIEKYFVPETHDLEQLSEPEEYIIAQGGEIVFAIYDDKVVGTCALIKTGEQEFELAKMAVSSEYQGLKIGYELGVYAIKKAKEMGAKRIWLESNRKLKPAISLYLKLGFKEIPIDTATPYARADIRMEIMLCGEDTLDNPVWNALISGNRNFAQGNQQVKYFDREVSPFVGFKTYSSDEFQMLHELIPDNEQRIFASSKEIVIPDNWKISGVLRAVQMVCAHLTNLPEMKLVPQPLGSGHIPQMLALARMTNPGPFDSRTIEFGHYHGFFDNHKLIAMAGQRLHIFNNMEISAVCTDPGYLGNGYAHHLLLYHLHRIKASSGIPFLHVRYDNERAIKVYERVGFEARKEIIFYRIEKKK